MAHNQQTKMINSPSRNPNVFSSNLPAVKIQNPVGFREILNPSGTRNTSASCYPKRVLGQTHRRLSLASTRCRSASNASNHWLHASTASCIELKSPSDPGLRT